MPSVTRVSDDNGFGIAIQRRDRSNLSDLE